MLKELVMKAERKDYKACWFVIWFLYVVTNEMSRFIYKHLPPQLMVSITCHSSKHNLEFIYEISLINNTDKYLKIVLEIK